ncbi:MAG: Uma2 family endonuclease [Deltaproteobacteria bacterium]|nr:Uma2 family endonuclease [Deltaproteobacteria bacterium]
MTARNPPHHATAADLAALPDDARAEIIDGDIVEKAAPGPDHGTAQLGLGAQLFQPFQRRAGNGGPGGWWLMTEVEVEYSEHQVYRHDLVGWRRERIPERPRERPVHARPDWVCEVLSASNATNDTVKKLRTLHRHGVPHCWLVDPERGTLSVLRWTAEGYLTALTAEQSEVVRAEPFDAIELRLPVVFGLD